VATSQLEKESWVVLMLATFYIYILNLVIEIKIQKKYFLNNFETFYMTYNELYNPMGKNAKKAA